MTQIRYECAQSPSRTGTQADTTHKNKRLTTTLGKAHIETEVSHHKLNLESASKNEVVLVTHLAGV